MIQGTEEITRGIDIVPSTREQNLELLAAALDEVGATRADRKKLDLEQALATEEVLELKTDHGELNIVAEPAGTRGYDDIRRAASREPLGRGVRPSVASIGDLARMLSALDDPGASPPALQLRKLVELDLVRSRGIER